jgi:hypothetical protein
MNIESLCRTLLLSVSINITSNDGTAGRQSVLTKKLIITEKIVSCFRSAVKDGRGERQ